MSRTRVLVVDDSPLIRRILCDMLRQESDIEIVGQAADGRSAVQLATELAPDVITMDVEMPNMTGLEALREIMTRRPTPVVMCSTLTSQGATITLQALEAGAIDFVCKPNNGALGALHFLREDLVAKVRAAKGARVGHGFRRPVAIKTFTAKSDRLIVVASSTGGPRALTAFFEGLPKGLTVPILVVQHMPAGFTASLAQRIDRIGTMPCSEATESNRVTPGVAFLARAGQHLRIRADGSLAFGDDPAIHGVRPAADYLFESAAEHYGKRTVGVVLTGMGKDGARGALAIHNAGGTVFGESEETCTIYGMSRSAKALGAVDAELGIHDIPQAVVACLGGRYAHAI